MFSELDTFYYWEICVNTALLLIKIFLVKWIILETF